MESPLRILITALELSTRRGVQNITRDLALGLIEAGHRPSIYTRRGGPVADDLRARGVDVEVRIDAFVDQTFDVIHGHHLVACSPVLALFPETPAVFVCHDDGSWFDAAPRLPNIVRYAAVSESMASRVAFDTGIDRRQVTLLLNAVDTRRFLPGGEPASPPRRALAFAKNADHIGVVRVACEQRGIAVDFIGEAVEVQLEDPAKALPNYDVVFASGLSAIEALACLRPVIVCDGRGVAGMVDMARYETWRPQNFGHAALSAPLSVERMLQELDRFDVGEAARVGARMRDDAAIEPWIEHCVALYREAMESRPPDAAARARVWARHLERWTPARAEHWAYLQERQNLLNDLRRARADLDALPFDHRLAFGGDAAAQRFVQTAGFEVGRNGALWTSSPFTSLRFRPGDLEDDIELTLEYAAYLPSDDFALEIVALVNGAEVDRWTERGHPGWAERERKLLLARDACDAVTTWLAFRFAQSGVAPPETAPAFCIRAATFRAPGG